MYMITCKKRSSLSWKLYAFFCFVFCIQVFNKRCRFCQNVQIYIFFKLSNEKRSGSSLKKTSELKLVLLKVVFKIMAVCKVAGFSKCSAFVNSGNTCFMLLIPEFRIIFTLEKLHLLFEWPVLNSWGSNQSSV